jgi:hypothetical protein
VPLVGERAKYLVVLRLADLAACPGWLAEVEIVYDDLLHADKLFSTNRRRWFGVFVHEM